MPSDEARPVQDELRGGGHGRAESLSPLHMSPRTLLVNCCVPAPNAWRHWRLRNKKRAKALSGLIAREVTCVLKGTETIFGIAIPNLRARLRAQ